MTKNTKKTSGGDKSSSSKSTLKSSTTTTTTTTTKKSQSNSSNSGNSKPSSSASSSNTTTARYERKINEKPYSSLLDYIYYSNKMLELEKEAESEEASKNSKNYRYVQVEEYTMGCNGRCNVKLLFKSKIGPEFKVGESITLKDLDNSNNNNNNSSSNSSNNDKNIIRGVISVSVTDKYIIVTMDEFLDEWYESSKLVITKILDEVTFKRLNIALKHLEQYDKSPAINIVNLCFNHYINYSNSNSLNDSLNSNSNDSLNYLPSMNEQDNQVDEMNFFSTRLNDSQKQAIKKSLKSNDMSLILGPPGTGKTTTIVELIRQSVILKKMKLLVCAPSNIAVDNIVEKLSDENTNTYSTRKIKICRVGHPARMMESILKHSIDYNISVGEGVKVIADIRKDIIRISKLISKTRGLERRQYREELRILEKELKQKEKQAIHDVIRYSDVVLCTLTGADDYYLRDKIFDMIIIDEAAQSIEIACWIALLKGKKCVLAGDHYQLPPTVLSNQAQKEGFEISLFERMYFKFKSHITCLLNVQYRMNEEIMNWSSNEFYQSKLQAHESVQYHLLSDLLNDNNLNNLNNLNYNTNTNLNNLNNSKLINSSNNNLNNLIIDDELELETPLFMIDTANCEMEEVTLDDLEESTELHTSKSKVNHYEVNLVEIYLRKLVNECKISEQYIGIITPYSAQVQALRSKLSDEFPFVEISTVDGFQGREKEAIIICTVRSNKNGDVGFLSEERRLNVAITRAKRHVCLIGDSNTLKTNQFLSRLMNYMEQYADIRSANDYL